MRADVKADKDIFTQIFRDGWDEFKEQHPRYAGCDEVVQKMLALLGIPTQEIKGKRRKKVVAPSHSQPDARKEKANPYE